MRPQQQQPTTFPTITIVKPTPKYYSKASMSISENEDDIDGCIAEESAVAVRAMVAAEREHEAYVDEYYESIPTEEKGFGWFDNRLGDFHTTVDLNTMATYHAEPRPYDRTPAAVPAQHPLRAIARVLHEAAIGSIVRICCFSLTDPFAIDMITHHGNYKTMNVILHP
jgi:hypothetical protein